ncbi:MAG: AAA family ATPase [Chromatiales bacterium]|jgi:general secretion pathway protein A|nr:AAA family ATPase [Chromatiales bacterium]MDH4029345.1 AAA family ATPase [Chromatiales bacterium]
MYTSFFGLNEKPFSITPDPRYLFLSERHAEALAHLLYGVTESGGFIQLTGEVGTGKTTIVRSLLEQLPKDTEVALVLNPRLTPHEFLLAICEELHIPLTIEERNSAKAIVDGLNRHLLDAHANGSRVVLIVDEAQNLSPDVLEQIRLLTNLETAKQKLLQIILIGQPELRQLLSRTDLRQLAQRITGRYHLEPLDPEETRAYIRHRLRVAGGGGEIFNPGATSAIHHSARGVPRLINVICDRALLGAYSREQPRVSRLTALRAADEVAGGGERVKSSRRLAWVAALVLLVAASGIYAWQANRSAIEPTANVAATDTKQAPRVAPAAAPVTAGAGNDGGSALAQTAAVVEPGPAVAEPDVVEMVPPETAASLSAVLSQRAAQTGTDAALASLLRVWKVDYTAGMGRACGVAEENGLRCLYERGTWGYLLNLDRPAVLSLSTLEGAPHQVVLAGVTPQGDALLRFGDEEYTASLAEIMPLWLGDFLLVWRPAVGNGRVLRQGSIGADVAWLRDSLAKTLDIDIPGQPASNYDGALKAAVQGFQRLHRLQPDGVAGARTLITLNSALDLPDRPRLRPEG